MSSLALAPTPGPAGTSRQVARPVKDEASRHGLQIDRHDRQPTAADGRGCGVEVGRHDRYVTAASGATVRAVRNEPGRVNSVSRLDLEANVAEGRSTNRTAPERTDDRGFRRVRPCWDVVGDCVSGS